MSDRGGVSGDVLQQLRVVCSALPEVDEELAWVGVRWVVRRTTFAHAIAVDVDSPPSLRKVGATIDLPATIVTFRADGEELEALRTAGPPFAYAGWGRDVVAMALDDDTDWDEVRELLTESYCLLAPAKLAAQVDRPEPDEPVL